MPKFSSYKNYGSRGITVCDEWKTDYAAFKKWAYANGYDENAPRGQCTIDRIDVNGDYSPDNCRWTTWEEQQSNKRNNVYITANGKTQTIAEWSRETGILASTINARINKLGWSPEKAVMKETIQTGRWNKTV